jgi:hypothetical protein
LFSRLTRTRPVRPNHCRGAGGWGWIHLFDWKKINNTVLSNKWSNTRCNESRTGEKQ